MKLGKKEIVVITMGISLLFLICYCEKIDLNVDVNAQTSRNVSMNVTNPIDNANLSKIQNANNSNTNNAIPYVLNLTNDSDTTSQVVNQVIQAIGGGQSTSLEQVLNSVSKGNSSSSLEQVIDTASNALNNLTGSNLTNGTGNNVVVIP
jgi:hypothetical protein